jgi:hypothetical protein
MDGEPTPRPLPAPAPVHHSRLTIVSYAHYDSTEGPTDSIEHRHGRFLKSKEQLWRRRQPVGPRWRAIDLGWYEDKPTEVGTIILSIESVDNTLPPPVEVGIVPCYDDPDTLDVQPTPFAVILPGRPTGDPLRLNPALPQSLRLRCPEGEGVVTVYVLPR